MTTRLKFLGVRGQRSLKRHPALVRAVSSEGFGRLAYYEELRRRLDADRHVQRYFDQETTELPAFYVDQVRKDLGPLWEWLPAGALNHDPHAYLTSEEEQSPKTLERSDDRLAAI